MDPILMWIQAACVIVACALVGLSPAYVVALSLGLALLLWWALLNSGYANALGGRRRSRGNDEGPNRARGDHHVAAQSLLAGLSALLFGAAGIVTDVRLWHEQALSVLFASLATLAVIVYASSLVDWYYVRPRVDGVVREPPCMSSRDPIWHRVTRLWYLHRGAAELLGTAAVLIGVVSLIVAATAKDGQLSPPTIAAIAAGGLGALAIQAQRAVHTLRDYAISPPRLWLGDRLVDDGGRIYYLLHVAIAGIVVREWNPEEDVWEDPTDITHARLEVTHYRRSAFEGCPVCHKVNPNCEWQETDQGAESRPSRLVW